jgi:hypothetical protein
MSFMVQSFVLTHHDISSVRAELRDCRVFVRAPAEVPWSKAHMQSDRRMSALPPEADIDRSDDHVSFGPERLQ